MATKKHSTKRWMQGAVKKSRKGVFSEKAHRAGKSTAEYAREKSSAPGELGKEARLAKTFMKYRGKKRNKSRSHSGRR